MSEIHDSGIRVSVFVSHFGPEVSANGGTILLKTCLVSKQPGQKQLTWRIWNSNILEEGYSM